MLAGAPGSDSAAVAAAVAALAPAVGRRVVCTGWIDEATRQRLLAGAAALAYPSLDEGFGLPVLEAYGADVPVVAADAGALPEVTGDAALLVDPTDADALAEALRRVLDDDAERTRLVAAGRRRLAAHDWSTSAAAMLDLYRDARAERTTGTRGTR